MQASEAMDLLYRQGIITPAFDLIDWRLVNKALHSTSEVFLVFACKQAFGFTAVNYYLFK
jgi:hypothetical protein